MGINSATYAWVGVVLGAFAAVSTLFGQERKRPTAVYAGIIMTLVAAGVQGIATSSAAREGDRFQARVIELQNRAIEQGSTIQELQRELTARADTTARLSQQLAGRTQELAEYVSGGNSIPAFEVKSAGRRVQFAVFGRGKYPIYNLRVDLSRVVGGAMFGKALFGEALFDGPVEIPVRLENSTINELSEAQRVTLGSDEPPTDRDIEYQAWLHARNGWWRHVVRLEADGNGWRIAEDKLIASSATYHPASR